jgi:hypothetical protein
MMPPAGSRAHTTLLASQGHHVTPVRRYALISKLAVDFDRNCLRLAGIESATARAVA